MKRITMGFINQSFASIYTKVVRYMFYTTNVIKETLLNRTKSNIDLITMAK